MALGLCPGGNVCPPGSPSGNLRAHLSSGLPSGLCSPTVTHLRALPPGLCPHKGVPINLYDWRALKAQCSTFQS